MPHFLTGRPLQRAPEDLGQSTKLGFSLFPLFTHREQQSPKLKLRFLFSITRKAVFLKLVTQAKQVKPLPGCCEKRVESLLCWQR